ncbi:MAG: CDP-diacylglycerol--glycerol-3-phosphate 3-phosphatidyltransferase [Legionellales bacterium]|nr:CDP-diacylglycerol--glycerol-3-phosphate 3-phosphatidyltransferase [Legionellales bacterium]
MNIPNCLTFVRIFFIPLLVILFYLPLQWGHLYTALIFALAGFTDWLDGYLARQLGQISRLGAFLDPVADKLIVATALLLIVHESNLPLIDIPAAIIVGREIAVSALREWMAEIGERASVAVSFLGKVKTTVQMIAIFLLLLGRANPQPRFEFMTNLAFVGYIMLCIAAVLTLWSMFLYLKAAWPVLRQSS